jgi:hypothetical protein
LGSSWTKEIGYLGNPRLHMARKNAVDAVKAEADRYAANVFPIIREAQKAGARTLRRLRKHSTPEGSPRHAGASGTRNRSQTSWGEHSEGKLSRWRRARCRREGPTRTPQRDTPVLVSILTELSGPTGLEFSRPAAVSIAR